MTKLMALTAVIGFAVDQISKLYVVFWLDLINLQEIDVFAPFLEFRMAWNYGVNFGLFSGQSEVQRTALILIALGISAVVAFWAIRHGSGRLTPVAAGLLIGGALGNVLDRLIYGAVVDFLNMSCCGIENPFVFNLADVAIFLGAIGLMFAPHPQDPTVADRDKNG